MESGLTLLQTNVITIRISEANWSKISGDEFSSFTGREAPGLT